MSVMHLVALMASAKPFALKAQGASGGGTSITKPGGGGGPAVGDVVFIAAIAGAATTLTTSGGSTWSSTSRGIVVGALVVWTKILNATDVNNAWSFDNAASAQVFVFSGGQAAAITAKINVANSGTSITGSYSPAANHKGCVAFLAQTNAGSITDNNSAFAQLGNVIPVNGQIAQGYVDYLIRNYSGGAISWTFGSGSASAALIAFEVA